MHSLNSLGELLVQMQLLPAEQWRQARQELGAKSDLTDFVRCVRQFPAWWDRSGSAPALSDYQARWIRRLGGRERTARLKKALRLDNYLILEELGEGGMGVVYKGWDLTERRLVAIKRIKGSSIETQRRFRREARIQKHLSHTHITQFLRLVRSPRSMLLVLEYIEGRTLAEEVKARGPIPWQDAVRWIMDILRALDYLHRLKIIHRDLKPSNIILQKRPEAVMAKLLDLGLAKCLDPSSLTQTATKDARTVGDAILGTFEYMAPEQWRGAEAIVPASDVYSLGCTLYFVLTGSPPFVANSLVAYCNAHTNAPPPPLSLTQADVPAALNELVQQMLSKKPADRRPPAELLRQFGNLFRPDPPSSVPPPAWAEAQDFPSRSAESPPSPQHTPKPQRALSPSAIPPLPADERFAPFPSTVTVNVSGWRTFWVALVRSRGLVLKLLFFLLVSLAAAGSLLVWWLRS